MQMRIWKAALPLATKTRQSQKTTIHHSPRLKTGPAIIDAMFANLLKNYRALSLSRKICAPVGLVILSPVLLAIGFIMLISYVFGSALEVVHGKFPDYD